MNSMLNEAHTLLPELTAYRRWLHAHAETGFNLTQTREYVNAALEKMGIPAEACGKCGLTAQIGKGSCKTFLLRADMDALPIREETGLDYACMNGAMHACGHDMHTAMLLGAARILKNHEQTLNGTVRLLFQPAEEIFEGAKNVIEAGVLDGVDAAMMLHVTVGTPFPAGTAIISSPGVSAPAADYFTIKVHGKACHGSTPQNGVDPLVAAAHILLALQEIQTRELGMGDQAVLTVGKIYGGSAANTIADTVEMSGTIRTLDEKVRMMLKQRISEVSERIAAAYRAKATVTFGSGCPSLINDAALSEMLYTVASETLGQNMAYTTKALNPDGRPSAGGSEDFAYISRQVPSVMVALCAGNGRYPLHHPKVVFDEAALPCGAALLALAAIHYLNYFD